MAKRSHHILTDPLFRRLDAAIGAPLRERARSAELRLDALEHGQREQLANLSQRLDALEARFGSERALLRGALAGMMDSVGPLTGRLDAMEGRLEFAREEMLAEVNQAARGALSRLPLTDPIPAGERSVWNPPVGPVRLNLGCGPVSVDGYVNVDSRALPTVDLVADVRALPATDGSVDEVRAAHLLEHFTDSDIRQSVLPEWMRVLRPGGRIVVIAPDSDAMAKAYAQGAMSFEDLKLVTLGGREYDGNAHFTMFSPASVLSLLEEAGFEQAGVVASARPNGACLEFEVTAKAPDDSHPPQ